jgi:hypothetical protein
MAHAATGDGSIIVADVTSFEVGRRLEYLSQRKEKNESQKAKKNELPVSTSLLKERRERGQMGKAHRQNASTI